MLRRKPTAITITSEDITSFEESRLQKQQQKQQQQQQQQQQLHQEENKSNTTNQDSSSLTNNNAPNTSTFDPNDELKPLPGDKARIVRTRDERIGIGRAG